MYVVAFALWRQRKLSTSWYCFIYEEVWVGAARRQLLAVVIVTSMANDFNSNHSDGDEGTSYKKKQSLMLTALDLLCAEIEYYPSVGSCEVGYFQTDTPSKPNYGTLPQLAPCSETMKTRGSKKKKKSKDVRRDVLQMERGKSITTTVNGSSKNHLYLVWSGPGLLGDVRSSWRRL